MSNAPRRRSQQWARAIAAACLLTMGVAFESSSLQAAEEAMQPVAVSEAVKTYLLRVRDITDRSNPSPEESQAVMMALGAPASNPAAFKSVITKITRAIAELQQLTPPAECQQVQELGLRFYQTNREFYESFERALSDKAVSPEEMQRATDLQGTITETGLKFDALRRELHERYGLGRL